MHQKDNNNLITMKQWVAEEAERQQVSAPAIRKRVSHGGYRLQRHVVNQRVIFVLSWEKVSHVSRDKYGIIQELNGLTGNKRHARYVQLWRNRDK